jgi:hypothetical protein
MEKMLEQINELKKIEKLHYWRHDGTISHYYFRKNEKRNLLKNYFILI